MSHSHSHPYHILEPSPWPAYCSFSAFVLAIGAIIYMGAKTGYPVMGIESAGPTYMLPGLLLVISGMYFWWRDVIRESTVEKAHTAEVNHGLRMGMVLFIASEVMFFAAFFWAFFHNALGFNYSTPVWPPETIEVFDPWHLPFYNTVLLLTSGGTLTRAHLFMEEGKNDEASLWLWISAILGFIFLGLQAYEYMHAAFALAPDYISVDPGTIYSSTFYLATGFHGFHVFVGAVFLAVCAIRAQKHQFSVTKHVGFESAAWYWHFVDVVWLFLFVWIYWILG